MHRRLEALEQLAHPLGSIGDDWPLEDQLDDVMDALRVHRAGDTAQLAADRQIHLMGLLCARDELPNGFGEHRFPSGTIVTWIDNGDGTADVGASGYVRVEDLPDGVREYWERMDPDEQSEREQRLYEGRHAAKERREQARAYEERLRAFEEGSPDSRHARSLIRLFRAQNLLPGMGAGELVDRILSWRPVPAEGRSRAAVEREVDLAIRNREPGTEHNERIEGSGLEAPLGEGDR